MTLFVFVLTAFNPIVAQAQSLVELYDTARTYDATYQAALAQYEASLARAAQSKAGLLPTAGLLVNVSNSHQTIYSQDTANAPFTGTRGIPQQSAGITITQPLYRPANWAQYKQGQIQTKIAQAQLTLANQDLLLRVSQAYFEVLSSQDSLALVRAQKKATVEQLAQAQRNLQIGIATITDIREAQARSDLVAAQEVVAENDLYTKHIALDQLVGHNNSQPVPLAEPVALPSLAPNDINVWVRQAEANHPAITQARLGLEVAELETEKAFAGHKPTIDASLGYTITNNPQGTSSSLDSTPWRTNVANVGLSMTIPVFSGYAVENHIKETQALEKQALATFEATRRSITQSTRIAYLGVVAGMSQVKALETAEASSQSSLNANRLSYKVGMRINIDVLNAQSQLFQTRRDLALARYNVLLG